MGTSFKEESRRRELMDELNQIDGVRIPEPEKWPGFRLELLAKDDAMRHFLATMRGVADEIQGEQAGAAADAA
jgi:hypothetical protein